MMSQPNYFDHWYSFVVVVDVNVVVVNVVLALLFVSDHNISSCGQ